MDALSAALIQNDIVKEEILSGIKSRSKGKNFLYELYSSLDVDEEKIVGIFCNQFQFPRADLADIMPEALAGFTKENALKYLCLPFEITGKRAKVAMVDPLDLSAMHAFSFMTGLSVIPHATSRSELMTAIETCFNVSRSLSEVLDKVSSGSGELEVMPEPAEEVRDVFQSGRREEMLVDEDMLAPAIKLVNIIIREALNCRASDIHIEPGQKTVKVRFRIDGVLKSHTQVPKWMHPAIASRIKVMSKLDISNRKTPQDGAIKLKVDDQMLDLRISTLPTHLGEKIVMRLLRSDEGAKALSKAGFDDEDFVKLKRAISKPQGIILVTGPTGSGKTTTLHGILKELRSEKTNIITVEDPVEYELEGVTQVHVLEKAGLTFANALRSILRQDPDVVMVGEIRDLDTGDTAFRASMTGQLVLSTLHTNGTAATITRLLDLGIEPYIISASLQCVVAQRLLRVVCRECSYEYTPDEETLSAFPGINRKASFVRGKGCSKCNHTGYSGRTAVLEVMELSPTLKKRIAGRATAGEIKEIAQADGMRSLYNAAIEKVYDGTTTLEEVLRVVAVEEKAGTVCRNCGRSFTGEECPDCGVTEGSTCPRCSGILEMDWAFCPRCGNPKDKARLPEISSRPKALIVDDEFGILKMVELALKPLDLEIHTAQNGREALDKIAEIDPNLVVTDINMPVMDGYELIKELRSKVNTMFIPIVVLTSRDAAEDKLKGFTYGSDDYITKPFDYLELQARVKRLIQRTYGSQA